MGTPRREVDTSEFIGFARRVLRAAGQRVSLADPELLTEMVGLADELDRQTIAAIRGLRQNGATWADIGRATGTSRQAAHEKWARRVA